MYPQVMTAHVTLFASLLMPELDRDASLRKLFRRCVKCPDINPVCGSCPTGQTCLLTIQSCSACAFTTCVAEHSIAPSGSDNSQSNHSQSAVGPIAGGVVGGITAIVLIVFLVWRFCIKKRRQEFDETAWPDEASGIEKGVDKFSLNRDHRASTHTVASVASSAFTRASNVIQIAYIPGVTNRSVESSPELIPPVPPIPAASAGSSVASTPHIPTQDQHFFMPDLRASTYSGYTDRTSMARSSIATTIYRSNAMVDPIPAQQATRGKAIPVSVKSSNKNSPQPSRSSTPPMPTAQPKLLNTKSSIVGRMATPKAVIVVRNTSAPAENIYELSGSERSETPLISIPNRQVANASPQYSNDSSTFDDGSSDDEDPMPRAVQRLIPNNRRSDATTVIQDDSPISPSELVPFNPNRTLTSTGIGQSSPSLSESSSGKHKHKKSRSLNQIIEEATRKAMREPRHGGLGSYMKGDNDDGGPFSDVHMAHTP